MKHLFFLVLVISITFSVFCQSFQLPGDGLWYRIARKGGEHAYLKYQYSHSTAHNPFLATGEFIFINARGYAIQEHHTMGYQAWNQPHFAIVNYGNHSELWVKATSGVSSGKFIITNF